MSTLNGLLKRVRDLDPNLGAELSKQVRELNKKVPFGLHFERHKPESVRLFGQRITPGSKVHILPPRGKSTITAEPVIWNVVSISGEEATLVREVPGDVPEVTHAEVENLVAVAEFKDHIFPGLKQTGEVINGSEDAPFHTVINGENYHVLQALTYTHAGKVDAIYIDPPYNTGAKDWKYNNDYVDGEDAYRHSKWLAFMERRLLVAKQLLKPDGALVVTIDEHEVNRLGLLLEQVFPGFSQQLVTIVNNPKGVTQEYLSRVEEYAFFVFGPEARIGSVDDDLLTHRDIEDQEGELLRPRWKGLLRSGGDARREDRKDMFFPVWFDHTNGRLSHAGEPLPFSEKPNFEQRGNLTPVWPIRRDMTEGRWGVGPDTLNDLIKQGFASLGRFDKRRNTWAVSYLSRQVRDDLEIGLLRVRGHNETTGVADVVYIDTAARRIRTVWHRSSHDAGTHGTDLVNTLLGAGRPFPFPKSLYAVEDSLRPLVIDKPNATVLDFFSGSGTTAHAVMRLNKQDGGRRQCISVTNNEVGVNEQRALVRTGLRPGDSEWEALGICEYITKPRVTAAITGKTPEGEPIKGDYRFTDEFPMADGFAANARFFTLTYESEESVEYNYAFNRIAPLLWLRAGAIGRVIDTIHEDGWDITETYAVVFDASCEDDFLAAIDGRECPELVYIVTNSEFAFQRFARRLPEHVETVPLYRSYLTNFRISHSE